MPRSIYIRRHKPRGIRVERALWLRVTVVFLTFDFFPGPIADRMEKIIDALFDEPPVAGQP